MSYEPTNWKAGDTVTSAKLNKIEQGIKNSILVANLIYDDYENGIMHLDKTWQEIYDADFCIINTTSQYGDIAVEFVGVKSPPSEGHRSDYTVMIFALGSTDQLLLLSAATPNDYPSTESVFHDGGEK